MSDSTDRADAEALLAPRMERWQKASWEDLDRLETTELEEQAIAPSGRCYRVHSYAFWDMEPWESGLYVHVKVFGHREWRRWWAYHD